MTDEKLIESAAKAMGMPPVGWRGDLADWISISDWNPLENDGEAFRLACALKLNVWQGDYSVVVNNESDIDETGLVREDNERTAVARRLIVQAAAAMDAPSALGAA